MLEFVERKKMLTEGEATNAWERMVEAEVRSFYFGDLASRYNKRKQLVTGASFFLSSGAAATVVAKLPLWVPTVLSLIVALVSAYSMAIGLDRCIKTATKLHYQWNQLSAEYQHLWYHWRDKDADEIFQDLIKRAREVSEAGTEMPYNRTILEKWEDIVYSRFQEPATT